MKENLLVELFIMWMITDEKALLGNGLFSGPIAGKQVRASHDCFGSTSDFDANRFAGNSEPKQLRSTLSLKWKQ